VAINSLGTTNAGSNIGAPNGPIGNADLKARGTTGKPGDISGGGDSFKQTLEQLSGDFSPAKAGSIPTTGMGAVSAANAAPLAQASGSQALKFSSHAIERMRSRGINFGPDEMKCIENAVNKAAAKGSKDTLVLANDSALIVSVKNKTVVTVMDKSAMKENVFTNIDSTVVI
jgi:flagellar operon protein